MNSREGKRPIPDIDCRIQIAVNPKSTMQAVVSMNPKPNLLGWQTATGGTGLCRVAGINRKNLYTGTFSLVLQNLQEPRPTGIVDGLSQAGLAKPPDIQIFVSDLAKSLDQFTCRFVVKIFALVRDVLRKPGKNLHCFPSVCPTFLFPGNTALKPSKFDLRPLVELWRLDLQAFGGYQERLQAKVNTSSRKFQGNNFDLRESGGATKLQQAGEDNVPAVRLLAESHGLDLPFQRPVHLELDIPDVLEVRSIIRSEFAPVADSELYRVEPITTTEPRVPGLLSRLHAPEKCLKRSVKTLEGSLTGGEVSHRKVGVGFSGCFQPCRLLFVAKVLPVGFVGFFSLCKGAVVQVAVCLQKLKHNCLLLVGGVSPVLERLLHCFNTQFTNQKTEKKGVSEGL
jgi:hypothetical protein